MEKFKDPIAPRECNPEMEKKSPWNFKTPEYDQRSSNFVNAGTHYGVGFNQPVGHKDNPKSKVDALPYGVITGEKVDQKG